MAFKKFTLTLIRKSFGKTIKYSATLHAIKSVDISKASVNTYLKCVNFPPEVSKEEAFELLKAELINEHQRIIDQNYKEMEQIKNLQLDDILTKF